MIMHLSAPFAGLENIVKEDYSLARHTWYRIGGAAKYFITPESIEDLQQAAQRCVENDIPIYVLGLGANLLVSDEGVDGAIFNLGSEFFRQLSIEKNMVHIHAGYDMQKLVLHTCRAGLAGLECLAGIPGTLGGGIRMNAGGKFGDIGASVKTVQVMDSAGHLFERTKDDLVFDYRSTNIAAPFIISATLELAEDDPEQISRRTKEIWMYKRNSQPLNTKNCGCIFKNPRGLSAGALIDQAGMKGFRVGNAEVSEKHANFIVAHPGCRAEEVMKLVKIIKEKVWDKSQVQLESEVRMWP